MLEAKLDSLTREIPALNQRITISVSNVSIHEFIRAIANSSGLNINVDPGLSVMVVNNFNDVRVMDILLFLARDYHLDISIIGNIITVYQAPLTDDELKAEKIQYDILNNTITLNYKDQNLQVAAKEITETTGKNVILSPGLEGIQVSGYIQDMPFENALEKFAFSNSLTVEKTGDSFYILSRTIPQLNEGANREFSQFQTQNPNNTGTYTLESNVYSFDSIQINASNAPIELLIKEVSDKLGISYFISSPIIGTTTLNIVGVDYEEFLAYVFNGSPNTYIYNDNVYIFSGSANPGVKDYRVIKLRYRTVSKLLEVFPESIKMGIELKEFPEMNSILAGGTTAQINELENFIKQIDKTVPVILIEVMIVYMNHSYTIATGIEAGLGDKPVETTGKVFPEINIQLGSESINNLLNSFNGFGSLNIGKVTPNFYLNLKALESQGIIDITSTPKLSTLNGHAATMSIGNTEYYIEERTDLYGAQNPQLTTTNTYQAVEAELSLNINPIVSGDNQITLEIEVNQSDFTSRISKYAPPGKMSRKFKSMVRVGDQEMILLGGLEEKRKSDTSNGVPLLSRIPVLKWIFSSRTKVNNGTRLNFFIKPTIIG
jgi:type IV pilus assembly protein PilQ